MKRVPRSLRALGVASTLSLGWLPQLGAQTAPAAPTTPPASQTDEETIELSPFVVQAEEDSGYSARHTLAGTRIRTELRDVGSAVSVVTQQFLQDTNSRRIEDLLVYTTGTEVASQGGNFLGAGDNAVLDTTSAAFNQPNPNTRVRGLAAADNLRDFFLTDIPWDSYNIGRVDLQRGPNSILFGIGSPAGIINSSVNTAAFKDSNKVEAQIASFGSWRATVDFNKEIVDDQVAVRVAALNDETKYRQEPAHRDDRRIFAAVRIEPAILNRGSAHTTFRANFEKGDVDGINPRLIPPMDAITPWFTDMNKGTFAYQDSNNRTTAGNVDYNPWLGAAGGRIFDGVITAFPNPATGEPSVTFVASPDNYPAADASRNNTVNGSYKGIVQFNDFAFNTRQPGYVIKPYKARSLTDASIFDFYNNLIEGENKNNWTKFRAYNLNLSQTFYDNKLGFELAYDNQDTQWGNRNFLSYDAAAITVDVMSTFIDGTPNPNVGRAMLVGGGGSAGSTRTDRLRESIRGTVFGEFDFADIFQERSGLATALGRHVLTFSDARQSSRTNSAQWNNWYIGDAYGPRSTVAVGQAGRDIHPLSYLSGSLSGVNSVSGLNLPRLTAMQVPTSTTVRQWDTTTMSFINYNLPVVNPNDPSFNDDTRPYTQARKTKEVINSQTFVWQGYFFGGNIVPMVGWRKDVAEAFDAGSPAKTLGIVTNYADPEWRLPSGLIENGTGKNKERIYNSVTGQTHTWSIVGHVPRRIMERIPGNLGLSVFYNRSENFQPDASRIDIVGGRIPSPTGKTKDYGIAITALDQRITLKVNRYETSVSNATLSGELGNSYLIGAGEAWGQAAAYHLQQNDGIWPGDGNYGVTSAGSKYGAGNILRWQPAGEAPYSQAAIDAQYDIQRAASDDWMANPIPESMQRAWGMTGYATGSGSWSMNSVAVTGDTLSKGTEFELIANPIRGLDISINASKTEAKRLNIAKAYSDWIEQRWQDYQGPMGDIRLWGNGNWALQEGAGGTVRDKFNNEVMPNYKLALALNGSNVSELRPWRFNVTSNYSFHEGRFKGANIGGSYRWQDKQVTGYRLNAAGDGYVIDNPYFGPSDDALDLWIGYQRQLFDRVKWRVQLNVRDVFASKKLIPVTVQPDGSPGAYRIPEPRVISLTSSFEF